MQRVIDFLASGLLQPVRITSRESEWLEPFLLLYQESFPIEERRAAEELVERLALPEMHLMALLADQKCAGLLVVWIFPGFLYVEHLAFAEPFKGRGNGKLVLEALRLRELPILLEVEDPHDAESLGRIRFYEKSGFSALPVPYLQPPYRPGESVPAMSLYSDRVGWEPDVLQKAIAHFHHRVYGK
ncbi:MAG: GNAT family N-acetyltransferase [Marinilabiliales bacterium]|nr:GNAT family N-acetyltransferase [Marinilabiliales bacterium]